MLLIHTVREQNHVKYCHMTRLVNRNRHQKKVCIKQGNTERVKTYETVKMSNMYIQSTKSEEDSDIKPASRRADKNFLN